jgi:hypothetical protein
MAPTSYLANCSQRLRLLLTFELGRSHCLCFFSLIESETYSELASALTVAVPGLELVEAVLLCDMNNGCIKLARQRVVSFFVLFGGRRILAPSICNIRVFFCLARCERVGTPIMSLEADPSWSPFHLSDFAHSMLGKEVIQPGLFT